MILIHLIAKNQGLGNYDIKYLKYYLNISYFKPKKRYSINNITEYKKESIWFSRQVVGLF